MNNAKPARDRVKKLWLSFGLAAGGVLVAVVLALFVLVALRRADGVNAADALPTEAPEALEEADKKIDRREATDDRTISLTPAPDDQGRMEPSPREVDNSPAEREPEPGANAAETSVGDQVQQLGGAESVSVFLGALVAGESPGSDAVEPQSQFTTATLRALYPSPVSGNGNVPGQSSVLAAVVDLVTADAGGDGAGGDGAGGDGAGGDGAGGDGTAVLLDNLSTAPSRRAFVHRVFFELLAEVGTVDRVYRALDGTEGAHLFLRNRRRQWWSVWIYVTASEIIDLEYRLLSDEEPAN